MTAGFRVAGHIDNNQQKVVSFILKKGDGTMTRERRLSLPTWQSDWTILSGMTRLSFWQSNQPSATQLFRVTGVHQVTTRLRNSTGPSAGGSMVSQVDAASVCTEDGTDRPSMTREIW